MTRWLVPLYAALCLTACRDGKPAAPAPESHAEDRSVTPAPSKDDTTTLKIDPSMLRDLRMTTATVERRTAAADVDMLGDIEVDRERYAEVSTPIDAQIVRLLAGVNAAVAKGQPLAELRSPELGRVRADLITAQSRLDLATSIVERKRALASERIVAPREVQEAEAQLREAQAAVKATQTTLAALGADAIEGSADAARFILRSPMEGTVLERPAVTGQLAQPAQPMFRIADLRQVWLTVHAFERDAVQVMPRAPIRITLAAMPGRDFRGRVDAIGRQVQTASRTVDIRIALSNTTGEFRPGMSATAHVPIGNTRAALLALPVAAVQRVGENWTVFIPKASGTFEMRKVGRGRDLGSEVEIASGLTGSETVVVEGAFLLKAEAEKASGGEHEHEE